MTSNIALPVELDPANRRVVPRTQWGRVILGLSLILFAIVLAIATFSGTAKPDESRATSRRMEAMERMIGKTGVAVGTILFCVLLGGYLIYESKEITTEAINSSDSPRPCGLCGQSSADTAEAFVRVIGGIMPFGGAFRCHACNACLRASRGLLFCSLLQMFLILISIPILVVAFGSACLSMILYANNKPGFTNFAFAILGISAFLVTLIGILNFQIRRWTSRLLGQRLDQTIRQTARIKRWGAPRRIVVARGALPRIQVFDAIVSND